MSSLPPFVGLQTEPEILLIEDPETAMQFLQAEGGVNTLCVSTHGGGYAGNQEIDTSDWVDHGLERRFPETDLPGPSSYIPHRPQYYAGTFLGQEREPDVHRWHDRDILAECIAAGQKLGMRVYARHLEGFHAPKSRQMKNLIKVASIDVYGRRAAAPCWNHPDYRNWWLSMTEEWCKEYAIDGILLGPERDAPLASLLYGGGMPVCFCPFCRAAAREQGIDPAKARHGMQLLYERITETHRNDRAPRDGMLVSLVRLFLKHPEILLWHRLMDESKWTLHAEIYGAAKLLRPEAEVGWMVPVYPLMHDIFSRALSYDYESMTPWSDFLKLNVYFDVNAARLHDWVKRARTYLYRDLTNEQVYGLLLSLFGHDQEREPDFGAAATEPFSPNWIRHELTRCLQAVQGKSKVYSGLGVNVPHARIESTPYEKQYEATSVSWESGADGLLLSREFQFMRRETLNAVRDATRAFQSAGPRNDAGH